MSRSEHPSPPHASSPHELPPLTPAELRKLAGFGYAGLTTFALPKQAQFARDARQRKAFESDSTTLFPTATAHALLALLDIDTYPTQKEAGFNFTIATLPVPWRKETPSKIQTPPSRQEVSMHPYHEYFKRLASGADWLKECQKASSHSKHESPDKERMLLIMLGHVIPCLVFLFYRFGKRYSKDCLDNPTISADFMAGLSQGLDLTREGLGYDDGKPDQSIDLDRSHCLECLGTSADQPESMPTYLLLNASAVVNALQEALRDSIVRWETESVTEASGRVRDHPAKEAYDAWSTSSNDQLKTMNADLAVALRRRVERVMAAKEIADDPNFDPVGLACAVRGLTLLDRPFRQTPLFREAVGAIVNAQLGDGCWPDGTATRASLGAAVLQPSVEVAYYLAASLYSRSARTNPTVAEIAAMRIARPAIQRHARYLELTQIRLNATCGWSNDRSRSARNPETWTTALATRFLHFAALIEETLARSETLARLTGRGALRPVTKSTANAATDEDQIKAFMAKVFEPDQVLKPVEAIAEAFIKPIVDKQKQYRQVVRPSADGRSFLLFGPPRSGKTYFVEMLAESLRWPLIQLDPGNFVARQGESTGGMLTRVFDDLKKLHSVVVLFDECDELVMSRGPEGQGKGITLITSSMLTRLADLHKERSLVFCFATNYYYRIDSAIRGLGRFDRIILFDRPDEKARERIIREIWNKRIKAYSRSQPTIAGKTVTLIDDSVDGGGDNEKKVVAALVKATAGGSYLEIKRAVEKIGEKSIAVGGPWHAENSMSSEDRIKLLLDGQFMAVGSSGVLEDYTVRKEDGTVHKEDCAVLKIIKDALPSRDDYIRWTSTDGLRDLSAVEGDPFGLGNRNLVVERWKAVATSCGRQEIADEINRVWDQRSARLCPNGGAAGASAAS